ncbi:glutathione S-transferase [Nannocystis punicea]|uniref:Glutathione S-transferase n=1 Tax=Nannocystis punicea TaxID=2995304 RepID=A0ABY7GUS3_9BACT|nr:glutathione S-transferase [Nannocystis poenicansa]WAS90716.1 glutathione S-transferase [Nannocystis poenicansa]
MQLFFASTSPFARKARIVAHELGLVERIVMVETDPWTDERLRAMNPLAKVPTLIRDDGEPLYDSAVICDYFDACAGRRLVPQDGDRRWRALRLQALAADACSAAGRLFAGERRGEPDPVRGRLVAAVEAAFASLEGERLDPTAPGFAEICAALLPGYCDFRWPERDWRSGRPRLAAFTAVMERRPSFVATRHCLPGDS